MEKIKEQKLRKNTPIGKIVYTLNQIIKSRGLSFNEIARMGESLYGVKLSPYQVRSVAYSDFKETKAVETLDSYFDIVLKVLHLTDKELLNSADIEYNKFTTNDNSILFGYLPEEVRDFAADRTNEKYIMLAYELYKRDKAEHEIGKLFEDLKIKK